MNNENASVTIPLEYYDKLKNCESVIKELRKKEVFLLVVKTEAKCEFKEHFEICNLEKIKSGIADHHKRLLECNDNLYAENMKLKYQNNSIWQLLKKKFAL
jgi:hypothetical protein